MVDASLEGMGTPDFHLARNSSAACGLLVWFALGCASPRPPQPPSLRLPELATNLVAERVGGEVRLTWVTPANTTDGDKLRGVVMAVVCREAVTEQTGVPAPTAACDPLRRVAVAAGPTTVVETLPPALGTGAARLLAYRVELVNDHGRSAGRCDPVYAAGGEAPPAIGPLTVSARREAVLIQWQPKQYEGTTELKRSLTASPDGRAQPKGGQDQAAARRVPGRPSASQGLASPHGSGQGAAEVTLTAGDGGPGGMVDAGGMLDRTARDGDSYVYVAQRVRRLTSEGHEVELRGLASPAAAFVYHDNYPPRAPVGLIAVLGGGFGAAPSIDLSWEPNAENDLLGYYVYRREGSGVFTRLNGEPVGSSAFRDMNVQPGHSYTYRVTAVDPRRNESAPSGETYERLRE